MSYELKKSAPLGADVVSWLNFRSTSVPILMDSGS